MTHFDEQLSKFEASFMIIHMFWAVCLLGSPVPITIYDHTSSKIILENRVFCGEYSISKLISHASSQLRVSASQDVVLRVWMGHSLGDILPPHMMLKEIARCSSGNLNLSMDFIKREFKINAPNPLIHGKSYDDEECASVRDVSLKYSYKRSRPNSLQICCFRVYFRGRLGRLIEALVVKENRHIVKGCLTIVLAFMSFAIFLHIKLNYNL